jgi:GNAT superfamily N-acetyltransferase
MPDATVTLRQATPADAAAVRDLTRAAYAKWVPLIGREPKPMTADHDRAVREHRVDLLHAGDDLVGLVETIPEPDCLLIENVAISPAHQRRGHGARLVAHAEQLAASLGYRRTRLYTNKLFDGNVRLYARLGYRIDREEPVRGGTVVHMSKAL